MASNIDPNTSREGGFGPVVHYPQQISKSRKKLPEVHPAWATYKDGTEPPEVLYTPEEMREVIRDMQQLPLNHYTLQQLTLAMNGVAELSLAAVETIKKDVLAYQQLEIHLENLEGGGSLEGINLSPDGLPMIKADVVEWSDKLLGCCGKGESYFSKVLQPFKEAKGRLVVKVCLALDLCAHDIEEAVCCSGHHRAMGSYQITPMVRS
jgi:hypothetical protein